MSELDRDGKMDFIMREVGVPESDLEMCKPNLEKLSDEEINAKYLKILARSQRIEHWRKTRGPPR